MVDADDPTVGRSGPQSLFPHQLESTLEEIISKIQRRSDFQPSDEPQSRMKELQTPEEFEEICPEEDAE
jgi:hypothetical protein